MISRITCLDGWPAEATLVILIVRSTATRRVRILVLASSSKTPFPNLKHLGESRVAPRHPRRRMNMTGPSRSPLPRTCCHASSALLDSTSCYDAFGQLVRPTSLSRCRTTKPCAGDNLTRDSRSWRLSRVWSITRSLSDASDCIRTYPAIDSADDHYLMTRPQVHSLITVRRP